MQQDVVITVRAWLKGRRKALDLTQEALAAQVGCAPDTVRKIEVGSQSR